MTQDFFIKVKGTGKIAWTLCIGCLAIAAATTAYMVTKEDGDIKRMSGIHLAIPVFSKGYRQKQGKVVP